MDRCIDIPDDSERLAGFELTVPNSVAHEIIETLVDQVLVAFVGCEYTAEYRISNLWGRS